jgi:hemerythrin-like domain-containing protein
MEVPFPKAGQQETCSNMAHRLLLRQRGNTRNAVNPASVRPAHRARILHGTAYNEETAMATRDETLVVEDAISMLKSDHRKVEALFREIEDSDDDDVLEELAQELVESLTVHATLEERIFYPAVRAALPDENDLIMEAVLEHGSLKMLISSLVGMNAGDALFRPSLKVLKEYVQHHVKEEENEMMPKAQRSGIDLDAVGAEMSELRRQLVGERNRPQREPRRTRPQAESRH